MIFNSNGIINDERYAGHKIVTPVTPTDIKVFYEDGKPYLYYTGVCTLDYGMKVQVCIPKMDLQLNNVKITRESVGAQILSSKMQVTTGTEGHLFTLKPLERTVTKTELEKELGYKLNISYK